MSEFTLAKPSKGKYKEKDSSFHAFSEPAASVDHIKSILLILKEKYPDASHIYYAYRLKKIIIWMNLLVMLVNLMGVPGYPPLTC